MADLTEDQIEEFKEAFAMFDKEEEGTMATKDLKPMMRSLGHNFPDAELQDMIKDVDPEGTGIIDFDTFLTVATRKILAMDSVSEIRDALRCVDTGGNGLVSTNDLRLVMIDLGEKFTDEEVDEMIREADTDAGGLVDYNDFLDTMTSH